MTVIRSVHFAKVVEARNGSSDPGKLGSETDIVIDGSMREASFIFNYDLESGVRALRKDHMESEGRFPYPYT